MKNLVIIQTRTTQARLHAPRPHRAAPILGALLMWLLAVLPARTEVYVDSDTTIDQNINDHVIVTGSATVDLVPGGSIARNLWTSYGSTVNISGGSIVGFVDTWDTSTVNLFSGSVGMNVTVFEESSVNVFGGSILGNLSVYDANTVNVSGGSILGELYARARDGIVNVSGGTIGEDLIVYDNCTINLSGGSIAGNLQAIYAGTVHLSGGAVAGDLWVRSSNDINDAVIHVYGFGLRFSGPFTDDNGEQYHLLTGTLQDGTPLNHRVLLDGAELSQVVLHESLPAYEWSGVLPPINPDGSSVFKAGRLVAVKFQLVGASASITDLEAHLYFTKLSDTFLGPVNEVDSRTATDTGNLFRYDPVSGQYIFSWSTKGLSVGRYLLELDFGDESVRTVEVSLR